jgi:hypothetical protein
MRKIVLHAQILKPLGTNMIQVKSFALQEQKSRRQYNISVRLSLFCFILHRLRENSNNPFLEKKSFLSQKVHSNQKTGTVFYELLVISTAISNARDLFFSCKMHLGKDLTMEMHSLIFLVLVIYVECFRKHLF